MGEVCHVSTQKKKKKSIKCRPLFSVLALGVYTLDIFVSTLLTFQFANFVVWCGGGYTPLAIGKPPSRDERQSILVPTNSTHLKQEMSFLLSRA